ncbi:hypothetical protein ACN27F_27030 [Solwaraspora sp. WMMB335]|uniref:hypothetical protein n=1 Tax=Solwaraspora sp. WMMB335 TaxID=3404118 RepID=UPI003B954A5E
MTYSDVDVPKSDRRPAAGPAGVLLLVSMVSMVTGPVVVVPSGLTLNPGGSDGRCCSFR